MILEPKPVLKTSASRVGWHIFFTRKDMTKNSPWWRYAVIYEVYVRSFQDSNGDGIGDIQGIISRIDYIASLGIDAVWITPVFTSPDHDNGYDISDYRSLRPEYGSMQDMEDLIAGLHAKGIRIILDMVINHTSNEHPWFQQARSSRDNPYYDFYHWWPAEKGEPPYRIGFFDPEGKGWDYNEPTNSWYLHYFSAQQPDLKWENPAVRREIYEIFRFWLEKGVDGFRIDAMTFIAKDISYPPFDPVAFKEKYRSDWGHFYAEGPDLHIYLREIHDVLAPYGALSLAEAPGIPADKALDYVSEDRNELNMICHFDGMMLGYVQGAFKKMERGGYSLAEFKKIYSRWSEVCGDKGWAAIYLGNHDQPRMVSRWGNDSPAFRKVSAKLLFTFLLTMRATPILYAGDELGMTNIRFGKIEDYRDIETRTMYARIEAQGGDTKTFLEDQQKAARDNGRTPFQWNGSGKAGFTTGEPWLTIHDNHCSVNRESEEKERDSVLNFVRELISIRKKYPVLVSGDYRLLDSPNGLYIYSRTDKESRCLIILNFTDLRIGWQYSFGSPTILSNNYLTVEMNAGSIFLRPYQALVCFMG